MAASAAVENELNELNEEAKRFETLDLKLCICLKISIFCRS